MGEKLSATRAGSGVPSSECPALPPRWLRPSALLLPLQLEWRVLLVLALAVQPLPVSAMQSASRHWLPPPWLPRLQLLLLRRRHAFR